MRRKFILSFLYSFLVLMAIVLYVVTFLNRHLMKTLFSYGGYYLILLVVVFWIVVLLQCLHRYRPNIKLFMKSYRTGLIISLILTSIIFISVKPSFRVLSDETNLLAISKSMTYEKMTDNVTMGNWYYANFYPINRETPKRPLLFPFLVYIIHTLLGYRPENAFILNFLLLFSLFSLIYIIIRSCLGNLWALSAVILVASQPVLSQTATSGGFDLLLTLFIVVCFICLKWFLQEPSAIRFQLLWVSLLMTANIRHESIIFFAIVIGALATFKYIKIDFFKTRMNFVYFSTPLMLLLIYWQRLLTKDPFEIKTAAFSVNYFIKNSIIVLKTLFHYEFFLPYATIINFIGFMSLFYFGYLLLSSRLAKEKYQRHLTFISAACIFVNWVVYISYHNGEMDHASNSRYFVTFCVVLSVLALMFANRFRIFRLKPANILCISILMFMLYHPLSVEDRFSRTQTLPRKYRFVMNFLKEESGKNRGFLIIADRPGMYTVHNYGAVNFNYANNDKSVITGYNNHLYENIFVIQDIEYATRRPRKETRLSNKYLLKTLTESQNKATFFTRISKVVTVRQ